jgi:hypothetical protein
VLHQLAATRYVKMPTGRLKLRLQQEKDKENQPKYMNFVPKIIRKLKFY